MFSSNPSNNYSSTQNNPNPCSTMFSSANGNNNLNNDGPSNCFRPIQQLYKSVYSPMSGANPAHMNIACICRPAERYKTTNMTYGSFYYDNSLSTEKVQKNQAINYDRAAFAQCYDNTINKMGYQSTGNKRAKNTSIFSSAYDPQESQYWTQPISDACCPTNCCNNTTYYTANCGNKQNNNPVYSSLSQIPPPTNKSSNVQVRCV